MEFYVRLGERLRALRNRAGLSQGALAEKLGRSASAIDRYELGERRISLANLLRVSKILGVAPETFFHGSPERGRSTRVAAVGTGGADPGVQLLTTNRLRAEHLRLLRELDRRLAYPHSRNRSGAVRDRPGRYGDRHISSEESLSPEAHAATLSAERLQALARRAGWTGAADPKTLRRFAALILQELGRGGRREGR